MATGTIPAPLQLGYVDDPTTRSFTFGSSQYYTNMVNLSGFPSIPSGSKIVSVSVLYWQTANKPFNVIPYSDNQVYLLGEPELDIVNLKVRLWYAY